MTTQTDRAAGVNFYTAIKVPVVAATTANITLSGTQTIDGVSVVANDRVLVKDQTDTTENGIYVASTGSWTRSADFDGTTDVVTGTLLYVASGSTNGATFWHVSTAGDPDPGDAMAFTQSGGALATVTAFMQTVLDDTTAAAARTTLGAGTLSNVVEDTTPQLGGPLDANSQPVRFSKGADVASASPLVLGTDGNYFDVTGTTGFSAITVAAGLWFMLQFDGALTLTHGASLDLPGEANITTAAGDRLIGFAEAANTVQVVSYFKADGTAVVGGSGGWEFVEAITLSGESTVEIGEANIASGYDYELRGSHLKFSADMATGAPLLRFGTGAGPTYQTTGYVNQSLQASGATAAAQRAVTNGVCCGGYSGGTNTGGSSAGELWNFRALIPNPAANDISQIEVNAWGHESTGLAFRVWHAGWRSTAEIVTGLQLVPDSTQTFDTGTIVLYRRKRSA